MFCYSLSQITEVHRN